MIRIRLNVGFPAIFCLTLLALHSHAQLNSGNLTQFTEKDGLPGAEVHGILTDRLGYLWIGSVNGLTRYDGYEFKRFYYNPNDTVSIHGLNVWSLLEDRKGKIWIASAPSFLNEFDPVSRTFKQYDFAHLIRHPANVELGIIAMCQDNNGRIYFGVGTNFGEPISSALLYKDENDDKIKQFISPDSLPIQNVPKIAKDKTGNIWFLSYSGIFKIDTKGILSKIHSVENILMQDKDLATDIKFDKDDHMWFVTMKNRLYSVMPGDGTYKTWVLKGVPVSVNSPNIIMLDKSDNIWIGTNSGIQFFDRKTGRFSMFNNGIKKELEKTPVSDLCFDSFGTLWIGSFVHGLLKYEDKPQLKSYIHNPVDKKSITAGWANYIYEAGDGKIWICTSGAENVSGLNILDTRTGVLQPIPYSSFWKESSSIGIFSIWENAPGEYYLSSFKALHSFSEKTHSLKGARIAGAPDTLSINYHLKDSRGNEWLCTYSGLYKKDKGVQQFRRYDLSTIKGK